MEPLFFVTLNDSIVIFVERKKKKKGKIIFQILVENFLRISLCKIADRRVAMLVKRGERVTSVDLSPPVENAAIGIDGKAGLQCATDGLSSPFETDKPAIYNGRR